MIALDRDAFICDMAETYHIYDYRQVPGKLLGTLAAGLGADSRIMKKATGRIGSLEEILLAKIVDYISLIIWSRTTDGKHNVNKPGSIVDTLLMKDDVEKEERSFRTGEEFTKERERILRSMIDG